MTTTSNDRPVAWGILGTGGINRRLLAGAAGSRRARVMAVASRDRARAEAYAKTAGIPRAHGSYEALLVDPEVEAVYISLPNSLHHPWTMAALAAGKHVLSEKPYSRHPAEVNEAFDRAEERGLILSEGFMWRHAPQTQRLIDELANIGQLETIRATFSFTLDDPTDIRLSSDLDGGSLMDVGCYCVSGARLLAGEEPEIVWGTRTLGPGDVDLRFTGVLRFPGGVVAEFTSGFTSDHMSLEAIGTEGSIRMALPWHSGDGLLVRDGTREIRVEPIDPYLLELDDVSAAIRSEGPTRLGRADALGQARTIAALYDSAATGVAIRV